MFKFFTRTMVLTFGIFIVLVCGLLTNASEVSRIYVKDDTVPIQLSSLKLTCAVTSYEGNVMIYVLDTDNVPENIGVENSCSATECLFSSRRGALYTVHEDSIEISISTLNRTLHQKYWICNGEYIYIQVYTVPETLHFVSAPSQNRDLAINSATFECSTGCVYPQPNFTWFYKESESSKQEWTTAGNVSSQTEPCTDSEKIYTSTFSLCRYTTFVNNTEKTVKFICGITSFPGMSEQLFTKPSVDIRFAVSATTPTLTNKTMGIFALLENDTVDMECISSPTRPVAIVTWRKGSETLTNVHNTNITVNGSLVTVRSVVTFTPRRSDNKKYVYCETAIPGQQNRPTSQQQITVYWPPSLPHIPVTDFPFLENQTGKTLSCSSTDYGNPSSETSWNRRYGAHDNSNSSILKLPRLTPGMNNSQVSCQLRNIFTQTKDLHIKSPTISLNVEYTPRVQILEHGNIVQTVIRNEGQALTISCHAVGNPVPTVRWKGQTPVSSELKFTEIDRINHGIYICRAEATSTKYPAKNFVNEENVDVVVYYAPEVNVTFSNTQHVENTSLLITCNAVGRSNSSTYKSMKQILDNSTIPNSHSIGDGVFKIEKLQLQDSGTYICIANNGIPDKNQQIDQTGKQKLTVKVSPKVLIKESHRFAGTPKKSVNLSVPFYSFPDIQSVMFKFPNGSEIVNSVKYNVSYVRSKVTTTFYGQQVELEGYNATLWIREEEESDFVNYTLVLDNGILQPMEWTLIHVSESVPLVPKLLNFTGYNNGVPTFLLVGDFNGGRRQTFVIETTVQGKGEWKKQLQFNETDTSYLQREKLTYHFNITGLPPNTYEVRVRARNELGSIHADDAPKVTFIIQEKPVSRPSLPLGAIAGSISGVVALSAVVAVIVIWKKRLQSKDGSSKAICKRPGDDDSSDNEVMTENLAYVSAEEFSGPKALNAKLQGKEKSNAARGDIYASVNKTKTEDPGSLYAMPDKKGLKKENKKERPGKDGKKGKKKKTVNEPDNVYENAAEMKPVSTKKRMGGTDERNLYEIPEQTKALPKKNVKKDGLIYADLDFKDQPKGQKKLIIHGLDDMTEYVQVDFTKKADPLSDSDVGTTGNK